MKAVILAGGLGTRISEETVGRPKPMVEIGGKPILWHIMKIYSSFGINDFVICLGYKGCVIKQYFANYFLNTSEEITFDIANNAIHVPQQNREAWKVTLVETGEHTMTGGRLKHVAKYLDDDFCFTYGDGVADIDIAKLIKFHHAHKGLATVTRVQPPGRFGVLSIENDHVTGFSEKPLGDGGWINGGFFVLSPKVLDYVDNDNTLWEREPLERLAREGQLFAFKHEGFWQPMDTLCEKNLLELLWNSGKAPWNIWQEKKYEPLLEK